MSNYVISHDYIKLLYQVVYYMGPYHILDDTEIITYLNLSLTLDLYTAGKIEENELLAYPLREYL